MSAGASRSCNGSSQVAAPFRDCARPSVGHFSFRRIVSQTAGQVWESCRLPLGFRIESHAETSSASKRTHADVNRIARGPILPTAINRWPVGFDTSSKSKRSLSRISRLPIAGVSTT